ncbi:ABC transporter substrate-binding protein [Marinibaculum pumilum]|uniref:ABC transporter substrate-binding protein n=1 Tax=Marinibaculum pumilum TaxID=1766165 RepID=A0ABV7L0H5_9PROT
MTQRGWHRIRTAWRRARQVVLAASLSLASGLSLAGCDDAEPIRIGFIGGLSGRSADIGEASRNAVQLALQQANAAGGIDGREIELIVRDDRNDPAVAAAAVRDLEAAGVAAIIGPNISAVAEGMLPVIDELGVITISPTISALEFAGRDDDLFRINLTTRDNARIYARHYAEAGIGQVAAAIDGNNRVFSQSWLDEFATAFAELGGKVVATDIFDAKDARGYSDTAQRLLASAPQAILLIANSVDTAQLVQQIRKLDGEILLVAAEWAASERLLQLGGKAIEGLELVQSYDRNDRSTHYTAFRQEYRERFQQEPGYSSIAAYDAVTVLLAALRTPGNGRDLKTVLLDLPPVTGLQQPVKFDRYGDAQRRAFFVVIRDGRFEAL